MKSRFVWLPAAALLAAQLMACGDGTGPTQGPPTLTLVNGVSKPTGLVGMTILIEGTNLGDVAHGKVLFTPAGGGTPVEATIASPTGDWTNSFVVTTVPQGVPDSAQITIQTAVGVSNPISFSLISNAPFSPSTITWTRTTDLPTPLQGLGAVFVPVRSATSSANYVFAIGGADTTNRATTAVSRAQVQGSGALGAWATSLTPLPQPRAYHTTVAATAYTAAIDTATTAAYVYTIGGVDESGATVGTVLFAKVGLDGSVGAWQTTTSLPAPRHSAGGAVFHGYLYVAGGADAADKAVAQAYRARILADGTLGAWETLASLPQPSAYLSLVNFGPYLYAVGGDTGTVTPVLNAATGTETSGAYMATINLRDATLTSAAWVPVSALGKARSKHSTLASGGALLASSGVYGGSAGSSENTYASLNADGTLASWQGANGTNSIVGVLGYSVYNEAAVSFVDDAGQGHVLLLGGADRATPGKATAGVVYY